MSTSSSSTPHPRRHRGIRIAAAAVIASAAPLTLSTEGVQPNDACAGGTVDGSCCENASSLCLLNGITYLGYEWKLTCSQPGPVKK